MKDDNTDPVGFDTLPDWILQQERDSAPIYRLTPHPTPLRPPDIIRTAQRGTRSGLLDTCRDIVTIVVSSTVPALLLFLLGASLDWW